MYLFVTCLSYMCFMQSLGVSDPPRFAQNSFQPLNQPSQFPPPPPSFQTIIEPCIFKDTKLPSDLAHFLTNNADTQLDAEAAPAPANKELNCKQLTYTADQLLTFLPDIHDGTFEGKIKCSTDKCSICWGLGHSPSY